MRFLINRASRVVERQRFFQTGPKFVWQKTPRDRAINVVFTTLLLGGMVGSAVGMADLAIGKE